MHCALCIFWDTIHSIPRGGLHRKIPPSHFRCRQSRHLSRNQDFDLFRQRNKLTSSSGLKALKLCQHFASQSRLRRRGLSPPCIAVFLAGNEFRLRIPFGKPLTAQDGAAGKARFAKQSDENSFPKPLRDVKIILSTVCYFLRSSKFLHLFITFPPILCYNILSYGAKQAACPCSKHWGQLPQHQFEARKEQSGCKLWKFSTEFSAT